MGGRRKKFKKNPACFPHVLGRANDRLAFRDMIAIRDRHDEMLRTLAAELIAKPAPSEKVIAAAIAYALGDEGESTRIAAQ